MIKPKLKSLYAAASSPHTLGPFRLSPIPLREYGASQTWIASQSTRLLCAHTDRLRRIRGKVDIGGLGYG